MTRFFTFTSDTSNKFWQIATADNTFTVTFGKVGTAGQSQTKTCDTPDRCQQEADKLIREKTGKGYVEVIDGVLVSNATLRQPTAKRAADEEAIRQMEARFDEIIERTQTEQLLPFLQGLNTQLYPALRAKIKAVQKYWYEYINRSNDPTGLSGQWGYRGSYEQRRLIALAAIVIFDQAAIKKVDDILQVLFEVNTHPLVLSVLQWVRPKWLGSYLLQEARKGFWNTILYPELRQLEAEGLLNYEPELFALSVTAFRDFYYNIKAPDSHKQHIQFLTDDPVVLRRELPTLFDYPTEIHNCQYAVINDQRTRYDHSYYEQFPLWPIVFERLLTSGKLDRLWFLERCLSVQTKDWNPALRQFFRKQFEATEPSPTELLALQESLLPLLAASHPHVVSWAVGLLKTIYTDPIFNVPALLDWAATLMGRDDCRTAAKTMLGMVEKLLKTQPAHRPALTHLLADVFAVNDMPLHTKAATLLTTYGDPADTYLQDRLQAYGGQMLGTASEVLKPYLAGTFGEASAQPDGLATYLYAPPTPMTVLLPEAAMSLPQSWNDFLFLVGEFVANETPLNTELVLNALLVLPDDRPLGFREQLKPYENKLSGQYLPYHRQFIWHALMGHPDKFTVSWNWDMSNRLQLESDERDRIDHLDRKRRAGSTLPLLSLPTHAPFWIAPAVLLDRLVAYQQAGEVIEPHDLSIAIARMPREQTEEAIGRCAELNEPLASLMRFCLGETGQVQYVKKNLLDVVRSVLKPDMSTDHLKAFWAVAARTHQPDETFEVFAGWWLADYPNVMRPFVPPVSMVEKFNEWKDWKTQQTMRHTWQELAIPIETTKAPLVPLVYSTDLVAQTNVGAYWAESNLHGMAINTWFSRIPQYPEPIYTLIIKHMCATSEAGNANGLHQAVQLMLSPNFRLRDMSMLVLACLLVNKHRETVALASEVVMHHLGQQTLDVAWLGDRLGWLLSAGYAPVQRLADALHLIKDVSPQHNKGLLLLLESLFDQFGKAPELPRTTRKLLETYLDLLVKLGEKPAESARHWLRVWQATASLKKVCTDLLSR